MRSRLAALEFISGREDMRAAAAEAPPRPLVRNTNVKLVEPPSCGSASAIVFIGKNKRGTGSPEQNGLYGGLFVNRAQAVKYALFENVPITPETIVELSREIELDMAANFPPPPPACARRGGVRYIPSGYRLAGPRSTCRVNYIDRSPPADRIFRHDFLDGNSAHTAWAGCGKG
jgi:hypothetical protein